MTKFPLLRHVRRLDPLPHQGEVRGACRCGWSKRVSLAAHGSFEAAKSEWERLYCEHLPVEECETHLLVNQFPGQEETITLPLGRPVALESWQSFGGYHWGKLADGRELPIIEIRTADGRVFKAE